MSELNCESVVDCYPAYRRGELPGAQLQQVREHVASCDECRAAFMVLDAVAAEPTSVPAGLHERVTVALLQPRPRWAVSRSAIAMAATLAAAVVGGSLLVRSPEVPAAAEPGFGVVSVEAAMLTGKASLNDLSVEELEQLLKEIES